MTGDGAAGSEKLFAEVLGCLRLKEFAGENINEGAIFGFIEVHGDRGSFDELYRRITFQRPFGETLNHRRTEFRHFNFGDEAVDERLNFFRIFDALGMAVVEINRGHHPPTLVFVVLLA